MISSSSKMAYSELCRPNDEEYPYAGIPRIVIETENHQEIKDRETEIPAKMQIWGEKEAESEIKDLTIRGRGNSSWEMAKKSYKIEFVKKQSLLGMPKDKDWALIANHADKSLMRNYIAYRLSAALGASYAPRCEFVELYLNGEYLGVYLLTETIKVGENRVNIPKNDNSYIVEVDGKYNENEQVVFSDVITNNGKGKAFRVHSPKNASMAVLDALQNHIQNFEEFIKTIKVGEENNLKDWIDLESFVKHYWVQEFTKNPDAAFYTSVYFTWVKGEKLRMGPVWDFDLAFGNHHSDELNQVDTWRIRPSYWYRALFRSDDYVEMNELFWRQNYNQFVGVLDSIDICREKLSKSAENNFKKWNILTSTASYWHSKSFSSYDDGVDDLKNWIKERILWIDSQVK